MAEWQSIGNHRVRIEEDILFIRFVGDVNLEHTRAMTVFQEQILTHSGRLFAITDLREAGRFSPDGRRFLGAWNKKFTVSGVAQYGGGHLANVTAMLMLGAIRALGGHVPEMKYVNNEEEGRAWVSEQRRKLGPVKK